MDENIRRLKELIDGSDNIVFFGGAGVSTESGIPDFRSVDGLYHQKFRYPPETIPSASAAVCVSAPAPPTPFLSATASAAANSKAKTNRQQLK